MAVSESLDLEAIEALVTEYGRACEGAAIAYEIGDEVVSAQAYRDQATSRAEITAALRAARQRIAELETAASRQQEEIQQTLGRALGYPRLADDQGNFPGATDADGVCVGDHVAESLASEAAKRIAELEDALRQIAIAPCMYALLGEPETCQHSCPGCRARKVLGDTATPAAREGE